VSVPVEGVEGRSFVYAVTAKHVVDGIRERAVDDALHLRLNFPGGGVNYFWIPIDSWVSHPTDSSVDAAVLPMAPPENLVDYLNLPMAMAVTADVIAAEEIGAGDEVALTGLFVNHHGEQRNQPIVRIGNTALMPEEPVQTDALGPIEAYLVESRSIGGLSGSPVFVNTGGVRTIKGSNRMWGPVFHWLGLMHGHWDVAVPDVDSMVEDALTRQNVNMGIGIVVPAVKILEVLDHPDLVEARRVETATELRQLNATPDQPDA